MQTKDNQRKEIRLKYKNTIHYQEYVGNELYGTPIASRAIDMGPTSIGFDVFKDFMLNTQLKITCNISERENICFIVSIVRIQLNHRSPQQYIVGAEIINISEKDKVKLESLLKEINIYALLDTIDLTNVVDIHFMAGQPIITKQMGKLKNIGDPLDEFRVRNLLLNLLDEENFAKFMKNKDINFILIYKEKRLRFNMHFQQGRVEAVCRIVKQNIPTPAQLGLPPATERLIRSNTKGLILISGRTGSGKTTTLASLVAYLSKIISGVIVIIEDPIEYIQEKSQCIIKQREIGEDTISYASAVRNALRQNPDVLIIGEILDKETLELLLFAAESGILVLSTFHSPNVMQVLDRIASFFTAEEQKHVLVRLSLILRGIIVQELFPRIIGEEGLVLSTEVFLVNDVGKRLIREADWKLIPDYILRGKAQGMQSMKSSIEELVNKGLIDVNFLKEYSYENNPFQDKKGK